MAFNAPGQRQGLITRNFSGNPNGIPVGHMSSSHQAPQQTNEEEASLDPSEFPALGAGPPSSNNPANGTLSYASHVNIPSTNGLSGDRSIASTLAGQRTDFTPDDFPALDATINQQHQQQHQPILGAEGNSTREAREQASAAAALTTQIARQHAHLKQAGLTDGDQRVCHCTSHWFIFLITTRVYELCFAQ
ncbi:hypothetical protein DFH28DRAFT_427151 [Melampsora americana]|nr:hypothetical protein DFH28DRAFT_427151 [Melampsora americana]